ncbi:MAG: PASTA domain-containing protein [Bacilli bacterium]
MGLYDDFKKSKNQDVKVVKNSENKNSVSLGNEKYEIFNEPIYKKKEFFAIIAIILIVGGLLFFFLYTPKFEMENLLGKEETYAQSYAENYDLKLSVSEKFNDKYKDGEIFKQSLKKGKEYKEGVVLEIKISKGPDYEKKLKYPDFSKMNFEEATKWKKDNFAVGMDLVEENNNDVIKGVFISEEFSEGGSKDDFKRKTKVKVVYSKGKEVISDEVSVSNFKGKGISDVALWAYENDITLKVIEIFDKYLPQNTVLEQSIKGGGKIKRGDTFEITTNVGEGVVVPNYYNYTLNNLENVSAKSKVNTAVKEQYHSSIKSGHLISQSIGSGTRIKDDVAVELIYSLGQVPIDDYRGSSYPSVVGIVNELNLKGANITIKVQYTRNDGSSVNGTVANQNISNKLVSTGQTLVLTLYK